MVCPSCVCVCVHNAFNSIFLHIFRPSEDCSKGGFRHLINVVKPTGSSSCLFAICPTQPGQTCGGDPSLVALWRGTEGRPAAHPVPRLPHQRLVAGPQHDAADHRHRLQGQPRVQPPVACACTDATGGPLSGWIPDAKEWTLLFWPILFINTICHPMRGGADTCFFLCCFVCVFSALAKEVRFCFFMNFFG